MIEDAFNYKAAAEFQKNKPRCIESKFKGLFQEATSDCEKIINMIQTKYNPNKIYQWGSLLHPENFKDYSDIDIAVEGLNTDEFFAAFGDAIEITKFPLDFLDIKDVAKSHIDSIVKEGRLVYERK